MYTKNIAKTPAARFKVFPTASSMVHPVAFAVPVGRRHQYRTIDTASVRQKRRYKAPTWISPIICVYLPYYFSPSYMLQEKEKDAERARAIGKRTTSKVEEVREARG